MTTETRPKHSTHHLTQSWTIRLLLLLASGVSPVSGHLTAPEDAWITQDSIRWYLGEAETAESGDLAIQYYQRVLLLAEESGWDSIDR